MAIGSIERHVGVACVWCELKGRDEPDESFVCEVEEWLDQSESRMVRRRESLTHLCVEWDVFEGRSRSAW